MTLAFAGAFAVGAALAAAIAHLHLRGRLRAVVAAARAFGDGQFDARLPETGGGDLRTLAEAMNRMAVVMAARDEHLNAGLDDAARQRDAFYAIINAASDGLLLFDQARRVMTANIRCAELLGFSLDEMFQAGPDALEQRLQDRSAEPAAYREATERHFAAPAPYQDQLELVTPRRRVLRRYSCPVMSGGMPDGRVFTFTDVTSETELDRLKSEFVSIASHELRSPLTSVHGALQLAIASGGDRLLEEDRELLEISVVSTERLVRLVNDLLDLSKIESGRMPLDAKPLDVPELLEEAARAMQAFAATRQIRVVTQHAPVLTRVAGDRDQLLRVLVNLVNNAVKYSPSGTEVTLAGRLSPSGVEISVRDQGPGIPPDQVDRLFRPFSRVGVHERQMTGGTGLGLAISRAVVLQHGGRIWVEPAQPTGSRFIFTLPGVATCEPVDPAQRAIPRSVATH